MHEDEREFIIDYLSSIRVMSEPLKEFLRANLFRGTASKGEYLLRAGETCSKVWFISKGLVRGFYLDGGGRESSLWFIKEGEMAWVLDSFINITPSEDFIQALEPTVFWYINRTALYQAYEDYLELNVHRALLYEKYYINTERKFKLREAPAYLRVELLGEAFPGIIGRVPDVYIHSFLGITRATFSRVKAMRRYKK